jgi:hypothetical protein
VSNSPKIDGIESSSVPSNVTGLSVSLASGVGEFVGVEGALDAASGSVVTLGVGLVVAASLVDAPAPSLGAVEEVGAAEVREFELEVVAALGEADLLLVGVAELR